MGMCFGVKDALSATRSIDAPEQVTILGELVHNEEVRRDLSQRGFPSLDEGQSGVDAATDRVLVTAHGISDARRQHLIDSQKTIVDTTCPLVLAVHRAARELSEEGRFVVVLGKKGHAEVNGIVEDLDRSAVVGSISDVERWPVDRLGVVCQTTLPPNEAVKLRETIEQRNEHADIRFVDTICRPTRERQAAIDSIIEQVEAVVVVGGRNSNNTRELVERAEAGGRPALHIQQAGDLDDDWLKPFAVVGLTAGTSTPDETINAVHERLRAIGRARARAAQE